MTRYMSAKEAADALGVHIQTIYAYVSRGMIRSEETGGSKRNRRYYAEDIDRLLMNKEAARNPDKAASEALYWGMPLLESSLTLVTGDRLYYRGQDALALAETRTFEQVVSHLWGVNLHGKLLSAMDQELAAHVLKLIKQLGTVPAGIPALQLAVTLASTYDVTAYDLSIDGIIRSGTRILTLLAATILDDPIGDREIATAIAQNWCADYEFAENLINAALILCADHELNASSFAARVVAGTGASPYAVVNGALSAFQGVKHGSATERAGLFLNQIGEPDQARFAVADWLKRGEIIPGFGHPLYPNGDPRAAKLLELIGRYYPDSTSLAIIDEITLLVNRQPNIDIALGAMAHLLGLSAAQGSLIFALGRCTGWIAHAIEQYESGMIRPRARYVGKQPE